MTPKPRMAVPFLSRVAPATPEAVGELRRAVRAFASEHCVSPRTLAAVELAVSEAVANVVVHAYGAGLAGDVRVEADIEDGELEVVVSDDGRGFTAEPAPGLGLGLGLIRQDAAAFELRDRPLGGLEVWLRFPVAD